MQNTRKFGKNQYLFDCFLTIRDPRVGGRCTYSLLSVLVIVLCGLICGCDNWKAMELLAKTRKRWLSQWIDLSAYITSLPYKKYRKMPEAIREHWQIENGLHYKLDVGLKEDQCPIYRGYADRNLSIMRKIVLKLLTDEKTNTDGIALKRMKAALSVQYTKKVVGF